jgi:serine phosphatase RsbU (regulator of sigma subunit)
MHSLSRRDVRGVAEVTGPGSAPHLMMSAILVVSRDIGLTVAEKSNSQRRNTKVAVTRNMVARINSKVAEKNLHIKTVETVPQANNQRARIINRKVYVL